MKKLALALLISVSMFILTTTDVSALAVLGCRADINQDDFINLADFSSFAQIYKQSACGDKDHTPLACAADVNLDGQVNIADFSEFARVYKQEDCRAMDPPITTSGRDILVDGEPFFIRSNIFTKLTPEDGVNGLETFTPRQFDPADFRHQLAHMKKLGYNTVRYIFSPRWEGNPPGAQRSTCAAGNDYDMWDCIYKESIDNLIYAINLAKKYDLKVQLTFAGGVQFPYFTSPPGDYAGFNLHFLKQETVVDFGRYLTDLFTYLKANVDFNTFLAVQPYMEPSLRTNEYPFRDAGTVISSPEFYVPADKTYIAGPELNAKVDGQSSTELKEIMYFVMNNTHNSWASKIRAIDPNVNIIYDQFSSAAVTDFPPRHVHDGVLVSPYLDADIIGVQLFSEFEGGPPSEMLGRTPGVGAQLKSMERPLFMIAYGLQEYELEQIEVSDPVAFLRDWSLDAVCEYDLSGWQFFNWYMEDFTYLTSVENDYELAEGLSPLHWPFDKETYCAGEQNPR